VSGSGLLSPIYRPLGVALDGAQERKGQRLVKISGIAVLVSIFVFSFFDLVIFVFFFSIAKKGKMFIEKFKVESPNVKYMEDEIHSVYNYETTELVHENRNGSYQWTVKPKTVQYEFKTDTRVPKLGFAPIYQAPFFIFFFFFSFLCARANLLWADLKILKCCFNFLSWQCYACGMGRKQWFNSHWRCYCQQRVSSCFSLFIFFFI